MKLRRLIMCIAATALLAAHAMAGMIDVSGEDLVSSRSTPESAGVVGLGKWKPTNGGFDISWEISYSEGVWTYSYMLLDADGSTLSPDASHFILEVSPSITADNAAQYIFNTNFDVGDLEGPALWTADPNSPNTTSSGGNGGNPNLPADLYGVKFDVGLERYTFQSTQSPVWGDFYVKDGGKPPAVAWNAGIGTDPDESTTDFTAWIPVPDTEQGVQPQVPEFSTLALLALGLAGVALRARRRS